MAEATKRVGRPTKAARSGSRVSLGLKVTADTKRKIEAAAAASGRTQSQEAEARLERSFDRADLLPEALSLAFGERFAGMLLLLGKAMDIFGKQAASLEQQGSVHAAPWGWLDSPYAFEQARRVAEIILSELAPPGAIDVPDVSVETEEKLTEGGFDDLATLFAYGMLNEAALGGNRPSDKQVSVKAETINKLLGSVADRLPTEQQRKK